MKTSTLILFGSGLAAASLCGLWLAGKDASPALTKTHAPVQVASPAAVTKTDTIAASPVITPQLLPHSIPDLRAALVEAKDPAEKESIAAQLADQNHPEAVQALLDGIKKTSEWSTRASLTKHLRAVSDPATLDALLPALLDTYGRGNTIFREISDTVARLAQADTVETLEVMHWQASAQAGQGQKILRTVAEIRNPPARRALQKLALYAENPALAAAAEAALIHLPQ